MLFNYNVQKLSLGDFHEVDKIDEIDGRKSGDNNPYRKLLIDFLRSGKKIVVHEFEDSYEAGKFHTKVYAHQKNVGGVKVRKRGCKVYLVREG